MYEKKTRQGSGTIRDFRKVSRRFTFSLNRRCRIASLAGTAEKCESGIAEGGEYTHYVYLFELVNDKGRKAFYDSSLFLVEYADPAVYNGECEDFDLSRGKRYFTISEKGDRTMVVDNLFWSSFCETEDLSDFRSEHTNMKALIKGFTKKKKGNTVW